MRGLSSPALVLLASAFFSCGDAPAGLNLHTPARQLAADPVVQPAGVVFRVDSGGMSGSGCWVNGNVNGCVFVAWQQNAAAPTAFLSYSVQVCVAPPDTLPPDTLPGDTLPPPPDTVPPPPSVCFPVEAGFGEIPSSDVAGGGVRGLRLRTNTNAATNPTFVRLAGAGGEIAVDWQRSAGFQFRSSGSTEFSFGDFTTLFAGTSFFSDALLSGSVVGHVIANPTFAGIIKTRQLIITVQRGP